MRKVNQKETGGGRRAKGVSGGIGESRGKRRDGVPDAGQSKNDKTGLRGGNGGINKNIYKIGGNLCRIYRKKYV